jgi:hypothetical protein
MWKQILSGLLATPIMMFTLVGVREKLKTPEPLTFLIAVASGVLMAASLSIANDDNVQP